MQNIIIKNVTVFKQNSAENAKKTYKSMTYNYFKNVFMNKILEI